MSKLTSRLREVIQIAALAALAALASTARVSAGDLPGETCSTPIVLEWGQDWSYQGDSITFTNNYDPALPGPSCTGRAEPGKDVVFAFDLNCTVAVEAYLHPHGFDGALYVVTDCDDVSGSCSDGSDGTGVGASEQVYIWTPAIAQRVYLIVDARDEGAGGPFDLDFSFQATESFEGACCFPDGHCEILEFQQCTDAGGQTLGPCTDCATADCQATPTRPSSWGSIKSRYR